MTSYLSIYFENKVIVHNRDMNGLQEMEIGESTIEGCRYECLN